MKSFYKESLCLKSKYNIYDSFYNKGNLYPHIPKVYIHLHYHFQSQRSSFFYAVKRMNKWVCNQNEKFPFPPMELKSIFCDSRNIKFQKLDLH